MIRIIGVAGAATIANAINTSNAQGIPLQDLPFTDAIEPFTKIYYKMTGKCH